MYTATVPGILREPRSFGQYGPSHPGRKHVTFEDQVLAAQKSPRSPKHSPKPASKTAVPTEFFEQFVPPPLSEYNAPASPRPLPHFDADIIKFPHPHRKSHKHRHGRGEEKKRHRSKEQTKRRSKGRSHHREKENRLVQSSSRPNNIDL